MLTTWKRNNVRLVYFGNLSISLTNAGIIQTRDAGIVKHVDQPKQNCIARRPQERKCFLRLGNDIVRPSKDWRVRVRLLAQPINVYGNPLLSGKTRKPTVESIEHENVLLSCKNMGESVPAVGKQILCFSPLTMLMEGEDQTVLVTARIFTLFILCSSSRNVPRSIKFCAGTAIRAVLVMMVFVHINLVRRATGRFQRVEAKKAGI